jgi:hypothetical protein
MNRRDSLKALGFTTLSAGLLLEACKPGKKPEDSHHQSTTEQKPAASPLRLSAIKN